MNVQSLAQIAEANLLAYIDESLQANARRATFACGGHVNFKGQPDSAGSAYNSEKAASSSGIEPIQVRFGESGKGVNVVFPLASGTADLEQLISACQPATFGIGGADVLDESYRKASKLDNTAFATSFCPYQAGIVDIVSQLLLPQLQHNKHTRSIQAELYKLNVYGAPSGKFKAHVDTPRSESQVGSLVVSLPVHHEGGQLVVRNSGQEVVFDWSTSADASTEKEDCVKWAAFYSDCEHEVLEVTAGNRITLTYNLYAVRGAGHLAGAAAALDPTQLPLYNALEAALQTPGFLARGRVLAVHLAHSYAHTHETANLLPESLKGSDWSLWETVRALGLKCEVVSVNSRNARYGDYDDSKEQNFADNSLPPFEENYYNEEIYSDEVTWGTVMRDRKITWLGQQDRNLLEPQFAYLAYGNQASLAVEYSRAVMLIRVPPFRLRDLSEDIEAKSIYDDIPSLG